jgi:hypothetical protein
MLSSKFSQKPQEFCDTIESEVDYRINVKRYALCSLRHASLNTLRSVTGWCMQYIKVKQGIQF